MCTIQVEPSHESTRDLPSDLHMLQEELESQIEELRRAHVGTEESRDRYIDLYDCAPIGFFTLTIDGLVKEANLTCAELLGKERENILNNRFEKFVAEADRDRWYLHFLSVKCGTGKNDIELLMQREEGSGFHAQLSCHKLKSDGNSSLRFALIDISERKIAEVARDNMLKIIEDSPDYIGTMDMQGRFLFHNKAARKMLGLTKDTDMSMMKIHDVLAAWGAELVLEVGIPATINMGVWRCENAIINRQGHETPVSQINRLHCDAFGKPQFMSTTMRDISEPKQIEQSQAHNITQLEFGKALAEKANLAKSDFISSMSHELRTPLNAILGFSQLLEMGIPASMPAEVASVQQISKAGWYLLELINEILDLAVVESGKLAMTPEAHLLSDLMLECQAMFDPLGLKRDIHINFLPVAKDLIVRADRIRLKQILNNLISNAIKYNREHGTVEVVCSSTPEDHIRISVKDSGVGLTPDKLAHLFQPFNRLGQESGTVEGTGIGLVVTKRLIDLMGGTIGVESAVGMGSEFWIELIRDSMPDISPASAITQESSDHYRNHDNIPLFTLLYVEDNPANLLLVEQIMLAHPHIHMLSARNGNHGIEMARTHHPDIILMDINLPDINGTEAMQILRNDPITRNIPIVALSANAMLHDIKKGQVAGFFDYITKPIKIDKFMEVVNRAVQFANNGG